jgi:hypothetical protein
LFFAELGKAADGAIEYVTDDVLLDFLNARMIGRQLLLQRCTLGIPCDRIQYKRGL